MPYVEAERPPFVVTNQRLIEQTVEGDRTLAVKALIAASRGKARPYAAIGVFLLALALCAGGAGAYFYFSVLGMQAAPYKALLPMLGLGELEDHSDPAPAGDNDPLPQAKPAPVVDLPDDPSAEHPDDAAWRLEILKTRSLGGGLLACGALLGLLGLRVFAKQRFFVICRSRDAAMRIRVDSKIQQDIILATLQAVQ